MSTPQLQLADFMDLFSGNIHNYGEHRYKFMTTGKEAGTNLTVTNKLLTSKQYKAHLAGEVGLGIIPITQKGECKFAVTDIDVYDADLNTYIKAIEVNNFPLVPFKSKSGGVHLFMFMKQSVSAKAIIGVMQQLVALLSIDLYVKNRLNKIIEVFPKQHKLAKGGVGSWINLPYYNATKTRQYVLKENKPLDLDAALTYIKEKRRTLIELRSFINDLTYNDGPPCLQTISLLNIMSKDSGRNTYLFSFGVYLKKKDSEFWEQKLFEINSAMKNPLTKDELETTIVNSLRKKDYTYKCLEAPCVDFCRKSLCKTHTFGIGKEGGYFSEFEYGKLYQIKAYEPYYEWEVKRQDDVEFKLLRFKNEDEIIKQDVFLKLCFRELHILPIKMKQSEWFKLINQALSEVEVKKVDAEDDTSALMLFKNLFVEFLLNRAPAQTKEQILNKRVFKDTRTNRYMFRTSDLSDFVFLSKGFRYYSPGELHGVLRDFHAKPARIKSETGKQFRVYEITYADVKKLTMLEVETFKADFSDKEERF